MMTFMLITHVIIAFVMTILASWTMISALQATSNIAIRLLMPSLALTAGTGVALALVAPMTFGRFCITMSIATVGVFAIKRFYDKRLQSSL